MSLKYLYTAVYADGSHYVQSPDDISVTNSARSCYTDLKVNEIINFSLSDGRTSYMLDLTDGGISVNGLPKFYLTSDQLTEFKLLYFRRITMEIAESTRRMAICFILGYTAKDASGNSVSNRIMIR